jgi:DNA-directed RNA polymerase specialized sigma24 family protein
VLIAKVYDQETFAEIAESMDLAVPTVKTHYVRALRAMRRSLQSHAEVP